MIVTRNGYIIDAQEFGCPEEEELTVTPKAFDPDEPARPFSVFARLQDGTVAVPRYWAQERFGPAERFVGRIDIAPNLIFDGNLRSAVQREAVSKSIDVLQKEGGGVLCLPTGTGKTVIALNIACELGVKTLVVVNKQFLMDQWESRIRQFVPSASVGRLQQSKIDVDGCDIVVGMLQSIAMRRYDQEVFDGFGLVIFDEVHVVPAPVLSRALLKLCSPCMLGISATPTRRDGMSCVISWFIGLIFMEHVLKDKAEVKVFTVPIKCNLWQPPGRVSMTSTLGRLCNDMGRNDTLLQIVYDLVAAKRRVIILSDRRNHCKLLKAGLADRRISCSLYIGGMKEDERRVSEEADAIFATYSMAKEGLDIPHLDTVVLATPRSDVVQACGRVMHGKATNPVIVDIVDQWYIGVAQLNKRKMYYRTSGFTIV